MNKRLRKMIDVNDAPWYIRALLSFKPLYLYKPSANRVLFLKHLMGKVYIIEVHNTPIDWFSA